MKEKNFRLGPSLGLGPQKELSYHRVAKASDLEFVLESSSDLKSWTSARVLEEGVLEATDDLEKVVIRLSGAPEGFYRLRVELSVK